MVALKDFLTSGLTVEPVLPEYGVGEMKRGGNLSPSEIIAAEITEDLEAALEQFATIAEDLKG